MRIYDITLDCGCMLSADGGGGLIPCCYPTPDDYTPSQADIEARNKCEQAWEKFRASKEFTEYSEEIQRRNP